MSLYLGDNLISGTQIVTDLNGKADVDLSNMSPSLSVKSTISTWGIPDYDNPLVSSFALDTVYQASVNGIVICPMYTGSSNGHLYMNISPDNSTWYQLEAYGAANLLVHTWMIYLPKNYYYKFTVSSSNARIYTGFTGFFPLKGVS